MKKITLLMHFQSIRKSIVTWQTICCVMMLLLFTQMSNAQAGSTYAFSQGTGTYTEITGGTVLGLATNDDETFNNSTVAQSTGTGFPIGFNFVFNGVTYNSFAVNTNGWIRLNTGASFTIDTGSTGLSSNVGAVVAGMSMDLAAKTGAELSYLSTGTAPNRKLVVQWKGYSKYSFGGNASDVNFQIVLNETTNVVDVIYGAATTPSTISGTIEVGVKSGTTLAEINNRMSTTSWSATTAGTATSSAITFSSTVLPSSGLKFSWTPIQCSGAPTGGTLGTTLSRNICSGSAPGAITVTGSTAFFGGITYQWEESVDNGTTWANAVGGTGSLNSATFTPPNFVGTTIKYRVRVTCANGAGTAVSDVMTINPQAAPATQATALTQGNSGFTSTALSWTVGTGGRRAVYISTTPITNPVSGSAIPAYTAAAAYTGSGQQLVFEGTGTSVTITGLTCGTTYYVKVFDYNRCGAGPYDVYFNTTTGTNGLTITTPVIGSLPAANNFTGFTGANMATAAAGWFEAAIVTAAGTAPATANPAGLTSAWTNATVFPTTTAKINLLNNSKNEWIISPKLAVAAASRVKFKAAITDTGVITADPARMQGTDDKVDVMISSDCGVTWTSLYTFNAASTTTLTNVLTDYVVTIPASYIGQTVQIGFQATEGILDDTPSYDFHLSNVIVEVVPNCDKPVVTATTNVAKTTATLNWNVPTTGIPTGYQYVISTTNTTPVAAGTAATGTSANATGLIPGTIYYAFVRTVCGSDFSDWSDSVTFVTLCANSDITSTTPGTRCGTGIVPVSATATGGTVKWYTTQTGGAPVGVGATYSPNLAATTTFYAAAEASTGTGIIGTGTSLTTDTETLTAFNNRFTSYKMQIIYTAAELSAAGLSAGNIYSMAFNTTTLGDGATNSAYTIKIGTSATATFGSTTFATTGFTTVYGPATYTHTASGWQIINFNMPYVWNGTSNVIIEISHNGANLANNARTYYTPTTGNNTILYVANGTTSTTGTLGENRLNIMFGTCSSARVAAVATVNTPPAFTLSGNPAAVCVGQATAPVTITVGAADYNTFVWTPSAGVSGNATTGWTFNPSVSTAYTLQASQSAGSLCNAAPVTVNVTIGQLPTAATIAPSPIAVCEGQSQLLTLSGGLNAAVVTLGNGTTAPSTTSYPNPFSAYYGGTKTQILYKVAELQAQGLTTGGVIDALSFDFNASVANTLNEMQIRIGTTTNETTTAGMVPSSGLTTVYNATYTPVAGTTGFVTFTLSTSYAYTGGNLIVEIVHNQGNSGNGSGTSTNTTTTTFDSVYTQAKDNVAGGVAGFDAESAYSVNNISTLRPNTKFAYHIPNAVTWTPVTGLYTDAAGTVPYTGQNRTTVYVKPTVPATYTATATTPAGCTASATVNVTINVTPAPTAAASQVFCNAGTVAGLVATGTNIKWYAAATGGAALASTTALVNGTQYFASQTGVNTCESVARTAVSVTINVTPAPTAAASQEFCNAGTVAGLVATGTNIKWYAAATGGAALASTDALASGSYYASQTINGCEGVTRTLVTVTVNVIAAPTVADDTQEFCNAGTVAELLPNDASIKWYNAATGGTALASTDALASGSYYASQTVNGCEGLTRTLVTVTVNVIAAPAIANAAQTFCNAATVADLQPAGADIKWYADATGGTALASTDALVSGATYYASQTVNTCEGLVRGAVTATINVTAAPTGDNEQEFCTSATVADLAATGDNIVWYDADTAGNVLAADAALTDGVVYYASQAIDGCEGLTRFAVTAVIHNVVADAPANVSECYSYELPALTSGAYFTEADGQGTEVAAGTAITETTTLYVFAQEGTDVVCSDENSFVVTIANIPAVTGESSQTINGDVAADATIADIIVTTVANGTVTWYATQEDAEAGTNPLATDTQLTQGATYYAVQTVDTCSSIEVFAVTVDVVLGREGFNVKAFTVYPNPVKDVLNISYSSNITSVAVFNLLGQQVMTLTPNSTDVKVDMSSLAEAPYVVNVTAGNSVKTIKVIKTH